MQIQEGQFYHVYNKGNYGQTIFFNRPNYLYFLRKVKRRLKPVCDILAWCLMPNHFHFLIHANSKSLELVNNNSKIPLIAFSESLRITLSSYALGINSSKNRHGSLFKQNTQKKHVSTEKDDEYLLTCFNYIHQNPLKARLVENLEDWEFSSFRDYAGLRKGTLCNKEFTFNLFPELRDNFYEESYRMIDERLLKEIL